MQVVSNSMNRTKGNTEIAHGTWDITPHMNMHTPPPFTICLNIIGYLILQENRGFASLTCCTTGTRNYERVESPQ